MNSIAEKYIRQETLPFIFCPGCGHGIVVNSFIRAIDKLKLTNKDMACVSGIGCSSWAPTTPIWTCGTEPWSWRTPPASARSGGRSPTPAPF